MIKPPKTNAPANVEDYIAAFPVEVREILEQLRKRIRAVAPEAEETLKYRMPTYVLGENLVHFAGCREHIGWYPTPSAIAAFRKELSGYECSKGAVQLPLDQPMPYRLIERMVRFRVKEALARTLARAKSRGR